MNSKCYSVNPKGFTSYDYSHTPLSCVHLTSSAEVDPLHVIILAQTSSHNPLMSASFHNILYSLNKDDIVTVLPFSQAGHVSIPPIYAKHCHVNNRVFLMRAFNKLFKHDESYSNTLKDAIRGVADIMDTPLPRHYKTELIVMTGLTKNDGSPTRLVTYMAYNFARYSDLCHTTFLGYRDHDADLLHSLTDIGHCSASYLTSHGVHEFIQPSYQVSYHAIHSETDLQPVLDAVIQTHRSMAVRSVRVIVPGYVTLRNFYKSRTLENGSHEFFVGDCVEGFEHILVFQGLGEEDEVRVCYDSVDKYLRRLPPSKEDQVEGLKAIFRCQIVSLLEKSNTALTTHQTEDTLRHAALVRQSCLYSLPSTSETHDFVTVVERAVNYYTSRSLL